MKIIDLELGRDAPYSHTIRSRVSSAWKAKIFIDDGSGAYPAERAIPADIAERMARAAFQVLADSEFFLPCFVMDVEPPEVPSSPSDAADAV